MYIHVYIYMYMYLYIYIHMYRIYTDIHIYTHTHNPTGTTGAHSSRWLFDGCRTGSARERASTRAPQKICTI